MPVDISIIIPCRNETGYIKNTIEKVTNQKGAGELFTYELIIVDGKSEDGTPDIIREEMKRNSAIKLLINEKKITPVAFNMGISHALGRYICIIGAHAEIENDYLQTCINVINSVDAVNVGGPWRAKGFGYSGEAIALAFQSPFAVGAAKGHDLHYEGYLDSVWGGFYKKEVFEVVGLFDEEMVRNQDDELNYRIVKKGLKIWQSPAIKYFYICRQNLQTLFMQYMQYGYWKVRIIQKHKLPASIRHLVPGMFVGLLAILAILSISSPVCGYLLLVLLASYSIFISIATVLTCMRPGYMSYCLIMPAIFAAFHVGYGYGFLKGVLDFVILRKNHQSSISEIRLTR